MSIYQNSTLYFMSGTGNTYQVATWVSEEFKNQNTKTQIIPFNKANPTEEFIPGNNTLLGLFFPTHGLLHPG